LVVGFHQPKTTALWARDHPFAKVFEQHKESDRHPHSDGVRQLAATADTFKIKGSPKGNHHEVQVQEI
jgi:hypothetical protein